MVTGEPGRGLLLVYTGEGKGKTTAALGLALRAAGHAMRTHIIQFIKKGRRGGEGESVSRLAPLVSLEPMGTGYLQPEDEEAIKRARTAARDAWQRACEILREGPLRPPKGFVGPKAGGPDILVLDELSVALSHHLLDSAEVLAALASRAPALHVVVTGRGAPTALCEMADLVTEMVCHKHPYEQGRPAERGIDF